MVTSGEAGIDGIDPGRCGPLREQEEIDSAAIVGVDQVDFLRLRDGVLEYGVALRAAITEVVRRHRPEIVITNNFRATWPGEALNQADHIAVGRATLDAVRDAGNRWIFPEQLTAGLERWGGVREVWAAGSPDSAHAVDTSDHVDAGVRSLEAHCAYIEGLGWDDFNPREFLAQASEPAGARLGTEHAATFEVFVTG